MAVGLKLDLLWFWSSGLREMSMFSWDFEVVSWLRFWRWNLSKLCVRTHDMTSRSYFGKMISILGSVVPLAMFLLRLAKAKCGAFDIAFPQTILLSFAIQSQLSDSDSSDAPRTLWLLMAIHTECQRISTFSYHFLSEKNVLFSKKSSRTFNGSSWSKTFGDKV